MAWAALFSGTSDSGIGPVALPGGAGMTKRDGASVEL